MTKTKLLSLAAAAIFTLALAALPAAAQVTSISGKVTDAQGNPAKGVIVDIVRTDVNMKFQVKTNGKGEYGHYGIPYGGTYTLTFLSPDGKTKIYETQVSTQNGPATVDVDGKKIAAEQAAAAQGEAPPPPGMTPEQAKEWEAAQKARQAQTQKVTQLNALLAQNKQLVDAKQYDQAIQVMEQAVALDQTHAILYGNLADDYADAGQDDKAIDAYQKAIALAPTDATYHINLGNVLLKDGKVDDANTEFNKATQLDPAQAKTAYYNMGVAFYNHNQMDQATAMFDKVIALDPTNAQAYFNKGMALLNKATVDPATGKITPVPGTVEALQKSIQLDPNSPNAQTAKATLQTLSAGVQTKIGH